MIDLKKRKDILDKLKMSEAIYYGTAPGSFKNGKSMFKDWQSKAVNTVNRIMGNFDNQNTLYHRLKKRKELRKKGK